MNKSLLIVILLVAGLVILTAGCIKPQEGSEALTFEKSIINDAKARYPDADIVEIEGTENIGGINVTNVRVSFNSDTICPKRMRLRYKTGFGYETGVPTYIVNDCVYKCMGNCIITGSEEAIIAAHSLPGTGKVQEFIGDGKDIKTAAYYNGDTWTVVFRKQSDGATMNVTLTAQNPIVVEIKG